MTEQDVELTAAQRAEPPRHPALDLPHAEIGAGAPQPLEDHRPGLEPARADVDPQRRDVAARGGERRVGGAHRPPRVIEHPLARVGQLHAPRGAREQPYAELVLHLRDLPAELLLRQEQPLRAGRERALLAHGEEGAEMTQLGGHGDASWQRPRRAGALAREERRAEQEMRSQRDNPETADRRLAALEAERRRASMHGGDNVSGM